MSAAAPLALLKLKRREERRIRHGHDWVYSNEVDTAQTPLKGFQPGQAVTVVASNDQPLGVALVNPQALICARIISRNPGEALDQALFETRVRSALALRQRLFEKPYYRLIYGDSDQLSGLVVDRFADVLVVQVSTLAMEQRLPMILDGLEAVLSPRAIVLRNDSSARALEALDHTVRVARGELDGVVQLEENGVRFEVDVLNGQKTGWFYDHRTARQRFAALTHGQRVLDVFSYAGAWGVTAAAAGASSVICVDASASALALAEQNARLNGVGERVTSRCGNALEILSQLREEGVRFDAVVLDPPAFIKRRKDMRGGEQAYFMHNRAAMDCLGDEGLLFSASCSLHLESGRLQELVAAAAHKSGYDMQIIEYLGQGADHPVHPSIPETRYLKTLACRLCRR